jgi:hypothetical protein
VGKEPPLEGAFASPDHIGREVFVAPFGEAGRDVRIYLRPLPREHQQLLGVAALSLIEPALDLIRAVDVSPVSRKRAVLAVALASAG